jgi:hypothetical protein
MARACIQFGLTPAEYFATGLDEITALYEALEPKTDMTGLFDGF